MADKLQERLVNIETALGGTGDLPSGDVDKLDWHLTKIEDLIEEGGGGGGTTVVANPEMSGDEGDLTGIQVGDTKYKVGGGTKLYRHLVTVSGAGYAGEEIERQLSIVTTSSEAMSEYIDSDFISAKIYDDNIQEARGYIVYLDSTDLSVFMGSVDAETGEFGIVPVLDYCLTELTIINDVVTAL